MTKSPTDELQRHRVEVIKVMARAICSSQGPRPSCLCHGNGGKCHAIILYGDYAISALLALERAGYEIIGPFPNLTDMARRGTIEHDDHK